MQWTVYMRVEQLIHVKVEAADKAEALAKADEFDIVGDEEIDHTIGRTITRVVRDGQ